MKKRKIQKSFEQKNRDILIKNLIFQKKTLSKNRKKTKLTNNKKRKKRNSINYKEYILKYQKKNRLNKFCINHKKKFIYFFINLNEMNHKKIGLCYQCGEDYKKKGLNVKSIKKKKKKF